jgi:hypothetical protein
MLAVVVIESYAESAQRSVEVPYESADSLADDHSPVGFPPSAAAAPGDVRCRQQRRRRANDSRAEARHAADTACPPSEMAAITSRSAKGS